MSEALKADRFSQAMRLVEGWPVNEPTRTAKELLQRLAQR